MSSKLGNELKISEEKINLLQSMIKDYQTEYDDLKNEIRKNIQLEEIKSKLNLSGMGLDTEISLFNTPESTRIHSTIPSQMN